MFGTIAAVCGALSHREPCSAYADRMSPPLADRALPPHERIQLSCGRRLPTTDGVERLTASCATREFVQVQPGLARVVVANYQLLRDDFPLEGLSEAAIDEWLLSQAAWMRVSQLTAKQRSANYTAREHYLHVFETTFLAGRRQIGVVPDLYGRAGLLPVAHPRTRSLIGAFDVKGNGANNPQHRIVKGSRSVMHGMLGLDSALSEFFMHTVAEAALASNLLNASRTLQTTIGAYAVIALDGVYINGRRYTTPYRRADPAGLLVRQAQLRRAFWFEKPTPRFRPRATEPPDVVRQIHQQLVPFGVGFAERFSCPRKTAGHAACNAAANLSFTRMLYANVQKTVTGALVDLHTLSALNDALAALPVVPYTAILSCVRDHNVGKNKLTAQCADSIFRKHLAVPQGHAFTAEERPLLTAVVGADMDSHPALFPTTKTSFPNAWFSLMPPGCRAMSREVVAGLGRANGTEVVLWYWDTSWVSAPNTSLTSWIRAQNENVSQLIGARGSTVHITPTPPSSLLSSECIRETYDKLLLRLAAAWPRAPGCSHSALDLILRTGQSLEPWSGPAVDKVIPATMARSAAAAAVAAIPAVRSRAPKHANCDVKCWCRRRDAVGALAQTLVLLQPCDASERRASSASPSMADLADKLRSRGGFKVVQEQACGHQALAGRKCAESRGREPCAWSLPLPRFGNRAPLAAMQTHLSHTQERVLQSKTALSSWLLSVGLGTMVPREYTRPPGGWSRAGPQAREALSYPVVMKNVEVDGRSAGVLVVRKAKYLSKAAKKMLRGSSADESLHVYEALLSKTETVMHFSAARGKVVAFYCTQSVYRDDHLPVPVRFKDGVGNVSYARCHAETHRALARIIEFTQYSGVGCMQTKAGNEGDRAQKILDFNARLCSTSFGHGLHARTFEGTVDMLSSLVLADQQPPLSSSNDSCKSPALNCMEEHLCGGTLDPVACRVNRTAACFKEQRNGGGGEGGGGEGGGDVRVAVGTAAGEMVAARSTGEDACEGHGFSKQQCGAVGCCHWNHGRCFSSVGRKPCRILPRVGVSLGM